MNVFNKRAAQRIALVSLILAAIVTPIAWLISTENAENAVVSLAMEESRRLLRHFDALELAGPEAAQKAAKAVTTLSGGLFDIACPRALNFDPPCALNFDPGVIAARH